MDRAPQYRCRLTPELVEVVAKQAASYQLAMDHLVRLDIGRALPLLADYLTVMADIFVHPDAR